MNVRRFIWTPVLRSLFQKQRTKRVRHMEGGLAGWLPRIVHPGRLNASDPVEPKTELPAGLRRLVIDRTKRDAHFGVPDPDRGSDPGSSREARRPLGSGLPLRIAAIDVQIEPLATRRDLEFLIAGNLLLVRADECLNNVPIPEPWRFFGRWCLWFEIELVVRADVEQVKVFARPARTDFCRPAVDGAAQVVSRDDDARRILPLGPIGVGGEWEVAISAG